jgi:diacylglycerol kinase family enzyme
MDNILDSIGQYFRTQEKPDFSIQISRYRRNAISIINDEAGKAAKGDVIRVYAVGGEEIFFDCLNAVAHYPDVQLALIPYGESNNFLKIFGENNVESFKDIPSQIVSRTLPTDIIRWGVNYALNSCYIGMNSGITKRIKDMRADLRKSSFMLISKFSTILSLVTTLFDKNIARRKKKIKIDDVDYSGQYSLIHVANGPYQDGRITGASGATPDDGLLDISLIKASHPLKTLLSLRKYSRGKKPSNSIFIQGKKISVQSNSQMWIQMDNEYIQDNNVSLTLINHAVQIVAMGDLSYPLGSIPAI